MKTLLYILWCCTRVAFGVEFWPFAWWLAAEYERDENRDTYALHLGPLTLKIMCRFWPDGEAKPLAYSELGYMPGSRTVPQG